MTAQNVKMGLLHRDHHYHIRAHFKIMMVSLKTLIIGLELSLV